MPNWFKIGKKYKTDIRLQYFNTTQIQWDFKLVLLVQKLQQINIRIANLCGLVVAFNQRELATNWATLKSFKSNKYKFKQEMNRL